MVQTWCKPLLKVYHSVHAHRRYNTDERIGFTRWGEALGRHCGDKVLYPPRVTILFGSAVVECNPGPALPSLTLVSGEMMISLVLTAERATIWRSHRENKRSGVDGSCSHRMVIPTPLVVQDPD